MRPAKENDPRERLPGGRHPSNTIGQAGKAFADRLLQTPVNHANRRAATERPCEPWSADSSDVKGSTHQFPPRPEPEGDEATLVAGRDSVMGLLACLTSGTPGVIGQGRRSARDGHDSLGDERPFCTLKVRKGFFVGYGSPCRAQFARLGLSCFLFTWKKGVSPCLLLS